MTRDQFGAWVLIYAAFLVPLAMLAIAEVRAAWRQTSRANLDAVMRQDDPVDRHIAKMLERPHYVIGDRSDPARVEQMAAIAEAEEAWDRDVWGGR